MPRQICRLGPVPGIAGQEKPMVFEAGQLLAGDPLLNELVAVKDDSIVIGDGPKTAVELPVGILG